MTAAPQPAHSCAEEIRAFLARSIGEAAMVGDGENIFERGIVNSSFALQLVLFLEAKFGVTVENEDLDLANFASVGAMAAFTARKLSA